MVINISRKPNQVNLSDNNVKKYQFHNGVLYWCDFFSTIGWIWFIAYEKARKPRENIDIIFIANAMKSVERKFLERKIFFENSNKIWNNHMVNWSNFTEKTKKRYPSMTFLMRANLSWKVVVFPNKKNTFRYILLQFHWNALFYFRSCPSWYKLWISKNFVLSWDKRVEKMYNESDKKMFMISLSVTLNYFFRSWLLSFRLPNFIGCAIGKTENGSQQIHVSKLTGVRLYVDSIEYDKIE